MLGGEGGGRQKLGGTKYRKTGSDDMSILHHQYLLTGLSEPDKDKLQSRYMSLYIYVGFYLSSR